MKVSVVIGVYNGIELLNNTISSVLKQTYQDFEVIIIDDGSGKKTFEYLNSLSDPRIKVFHKEKNEGLTKALIDGCLHAGGEYIARIDNGDFMVPEQRLQIQAQFLDMNPDVVLVAGKIEIIDHINNDIYHSRNRKHAMKTNFSHVTVMFRKNAYMQSGGYSAGHYTGQDSELWPRLLQFGRGVNLDYVFAIAPMRGDSISVKMNNTQIRNSIRRKINNIKNGPNRFKFALSLLADLIKLTLPINVRVKWRYRLNMEYIGKYAK